MRQRRPVSLHWVFLKKVDVIKRFFKSKVRVWGVRAGMGAFVRTLDKVYSIKDSESYSAVADMMDKEKTRRDLMLAGTSLVSILTRTHWVGSTVGGGRFLVDAVRIVVEPNSFFLASGFGPLEAELRSTARLLVNAVYSFALEFAQDYFASTMSLNELMTLFCFFLTKYNFKLSVSN